MAVQAQHLVVQGFSSQRVAPEQKGRQLALDHIDLGLVDRPEQPGHAVVSLDFQVGLTHGRAWLGKIVVMDVELGVHVELDGLPVAGRKLRSAPRAAQLKDRKPRNFHDCS